MIANAGSHVKSVQIPIDHVRLQADLVIPSGAHALVIFAHGSGSSRHSPRNQHVARVLNAARLGTLLMDLLSPEEEAVDRQTRHLRFDIPMLAKRLSGALAWLRQQPETQPLRFGLFGASTGAGAALIVAAAQPTDIGAVVSRGGRIDLAGKSLPQVQAPTLLIVGAEDAPVISMNREAQAKMRAETRLETVPGATHLFEEPGALDAVAQLAGDWFQRALGDKDAAT